MINKIQKYHSDLNEQSQSKGFINPARLQNMGAMIQMAQLGLGTLLDINQFEKTEN